MSIPAAIRSRPLTFLFGLAAVSLLGLLLVPPIPQSQIYHGFADRRTLLGIPNFWNVVSNLPFILVGALGLWKVRRDLSASIFFLGVFLTGFTSSYYHWAPNDWGLFWDRLPMTFAFMAILANVIEERIDERVGRLLLWPLVALGVAEPADLAAGRRSPALRLGAVLSLRRPAADVLAVSAEVQRHLYWFVAAGFYLLAKLLEHYDAAIYSALRVMSGHPIKHVAAACACYAIYLAFRKRQPIG